MGNSVTYFRMGQSNHHFDHFVTQLRTKIIKRIRHSPELRPNEIRNLTIVMTPTIFNNFSQYCENQYCVPLLVSLQRLCEDDPFKIIRCHPVKGGRGYPVYFINIDLGGGAKEAPP